MTNIKKLGLTALAGSLVAVSAQAGEMSVSGSASVTYTTGEAADSSQTIGQKTDLTFAGSGTLDNGWDVNHTIVMDDTGSLSTSSTTLTMGSMGTIGVGTGNGFSVHGAYDETYPTAYEENSDAGGNSPSNYMGSFADDSGVTYKAPTFSIAGADISVAAEYSFQAGTDTTNDGGTNARANDRGKGYGVGITAAYAGLTVGAYAAEAENVTNGGYTPTHDEFNGSAFINYSFGPVSVGYQQVYIDSGSDTADELTTAAKTVGSSSGIFEDQSMSIAFNVNENLSISYSETESTYSTQGYEDGTTTKTPDVTQDTDSLQIAYSMGGMSVKAYRTEISNPAHDSDADELSVNEIAIGLAF